MKSVDKSDVKEEKTSSNKGTTGGDEKKDDNVYPREEHFKCRGCKQEIPVIVTSDLGYASFLRSKFLHRDYVKTMRGEIVNCGEVLLPKKKSTLKSVDEEEEDIDQITFDQLISRPVMKETRDMLKDYLVVFPSRGMGIDISLIILHGPNGTGKTEFCSALKNDPDFSNCDFDDIDIYDLIDAKMGKSSEKVAEVTKSWEDAYKKSGKKRIQVKILDEGELVFPHKRDQGSRAYAELGRSMLKHTGKFKGFIIIVLANDTSMMVKGAHSRSAKKYWPALNIEERVMFLRVKLESHPEMKLSCTNFETIIPYIYNQHYGDIRYINKLVTEIKSWYVHNTKDNNIMLNVKDSIQTIIKFNESLEDEYKEEREEQNTFEKKRPGRQPIYGKIDEIPSPSKFTLDDLNKATIKQHQTGFSGNGIKVEQSKVKRDKNDKNVDLICSVCYYRHSIKIGTNEHYDNDKPLCSHNDTDELSGCSGEMITDSSVCSICKKPRNGKYINDLGEGGFVHGSCIFERKEIAEIEKDIVKKKEESENIGNEVEGTAEEYIAFHTNGDEIALTDRIEKPKIDQKTESKVEDIIVGQVSE